MWVIALLTLLNACLNNNFVTSSSTRISLAGFPLNVYDLLAAFGLVWCLVPQKDRAVSQRVHPLFLWAMGMLAVGTVGGFIGTPGNGAPLRSIITVGRNFVFIPLVAFLAYRLTQNLRSAFAYCIIVLWAGWLAATIIPLDFARATSDLATTTEVDQIRIVQYVSNYCGLAAGLLIFWAGSGTRFPRSLSLLSRRFPTFRCLALAAYCFVGQFATLSRSDWLAGIGGMCAAVAIMPRFRFRKKLAFAAFAAPVLIGALLAAMYVGEKVSGRDVFTKVGDRIATLLPWTDNKGHHASDARWAASLFELQMWSSSPLVGHGFGAESTIRLNGLDETGGGLRHNTWTSTLAETGVLGFAALAVVCFGQVVVGLRMVRAKLHRTTVLVGALGVITGVHFAVHGLTTMSFNQIRWAIPMAVTFGVVLRTRAVERALAAEYAGYLPTGAELAAAYRPLLDENGMLSPEYLHPGGGYGDAAEPEHVSAEDFANGRVPVGAYDGYGNGGGY